MSEQLVRSRAWTESRLAVFPPQPPAASGQWARKKERGKEKSQLRKKVAQRPYCIVVEERELWSLMPEVGVLPIY